MTNILILNGHPNPNSFCHALAQAYQKGAIAAGATCKLVHIADLEFDPILRYGYKQSMELEPDLLQVQEDIRQAKHLVLVYPNWWSSFPALLKGFFDRTLLPGFAFKYRSNSPMWDKLLSGKTARMIVTMDTPGWYYWLVNRNSGHRVIKKGILEFCGFHPVSITSFSPMRNASDKKRQEWLETVEKLGQKQV